MMIKTNTMVIVVKMCMVFAMHILHTELLGLGREIQRCINISHSALT